MIDDKLVTSGLYEATIIHTETRQSKNDNQMIVFHWMIESGEYTGKTVYSNFVLDNPKVEKVFQVMVHHLGEDPKKMSMKKASLLINKKCRIHVIVKNDGNKQFNSVEHYYPLKDEYDY